MVQVQSVVTANRLSLGLAEVAPSICLALAVAILSARLASASVGTVSADYSFTSADDTTLHVHNTSATPWTNVVLSGVGSGGRVDGLTGSLTLGTIAASSTLTVAFSDFSCPSVFAFDFDDCSNGEVVYTLQGLSTAGTLSATFSPSHNASGQFVSFLGNDAFGFESDGSVSDTTVAIIHICGDGVVDPPEQCDDGNQVNGDGCDNNCTLPACGNGIVDPGEACDDGNLNDGDCCSSSCTTAAPDGTPCDDQLFCDGTDTCAGGACATHSGDPCVGGAECDNLCNETTQNCALPAGTACAEDGNPCTADQCDGMGACLHVGEYYTPCDDGVFCNGSDECYAGLCQIHFGDPCIGDQCSPTCDEATRTCDPAAAGTPCFDDGDVCTLDQCDGAGACAHPPAPAGIPCPDDGLPCTSDQCDGDGFCSHPPLAGGTACPDDGNACTDDQCDGVGLCVHPAVPDGTACDDANACTQIDRCQSGICVGTDPIVCTAPACYLPGSCDPSSGTCTSCPAGYAQGHGGCEKQYAIDAALLEGLPYACGPTQYTCSTNLGFGFHWTDTADASVGDVARVEIDFQPGEDCSSTTHTVMLNDVPIGTYADTSGATCSCLPEPSPVVLAAAGPADYVKGGANSVAVSTLISTCGGISQDGGGNYAVVTVTFADPGVAPGLHSGCRAAAKARIGYRNNSNDALDRLTWKWGNGPATSLGDFGDPTSSTPYEFCVFRETAGKPALLFSGDLPPGASTWRSAGRTGFVYGDAAASHDGVRSIRLSGGGAGAAKLSLGGQGVGLSDPALPLPLDTNGIRVQLTNQSSGTCWESEFPLNRITADDKRIKATVH